MHEWRSDVDLRKYRRWLVTPLWDGGYEEVLDEPYAFGRACPLDHFSDRAQVRLILLRSRWLEQLLERSGPDLAEGDGART